MHEHAVTNDVADQLFEVERSVDIAMVKTAKLIETMLYARGTLDLAAAAGQPAIQRIATALATLGEVRGGLVGAHANLERLSQKLNLPVVAEGGIGKPLLVADDLPLADTHAPAF